nr:transposase [Thioalkalivibrio sp. ALE20]
MKYSDERKEAVLKKLLPPHNRTVAQLADEEGISAATLYNWRRKAREQGRLLPDSSPEPEGWSSRDKFNAVLETAPLSEAEVAEYCRRRGLYPEQLQRCKRPAKYLLSSFRRGSDHEAESSWRGTAAWVGGDGVGRSGSGWYRVGRVAV